MTEVLLGYPKSPLNGPKLKGNGAKPGDRFRPALTAPPAGSGLTPRFSLFSASAAPSALSEPLTHWVDMRTDPGLDDGRYLVRPDGYLACSAQTIEDIEAYPNSLAKPQTAD